MSVCDIESRTPNPSKCITGTPNGCIIKRRGEDGKINYEVKDSASATDHFRSPVVMQQRKMMLLNNQNWQKNMRLTAA
jgi:hypothetical protein